MRFVFRRFPLGSDLFVAVALGENRGRLRGRGERSRFQEVAAGTLVALSECPVRTGVHADLDRMCVAAGDARVHVRQQVVDGASACHLLWVGGLRLVQRDLLLLGLLHHLLLFLVSQSA